MRGSKNSKSGEVDFVFPRIVFVSLYKVLLLSCHAMHLYQSSTI